MPLKNVKQYVESLRDGREVYYKGEQIEDVTAHPVFRRAIDHASIDYWMAEDEAYQPLAIVEEDGEQYSRYYKLPQSSEDLLARSKLIEQATALGGTLVILIKEIGTDALFSLHLIGAELEQEAPEYLKRIKVFYRYCRDNDLAVAVAQTDVKGNRSLSPSQQADPDLYLHIVEENEKGIVVRGAKMHTSVLPNSHEVIILPTRAMKSDDRDYALAFAIPVNTPGLKLIASAYGDKEDTTDYPITAKHKMIETLTVFDNVFVPRDRIFLCREHKYAGPLALTFVEYHRFTAVSYKLPLIDFFVGASFIMAEANGILRKGHVREKLVWLIHYAETVRALLEKAAYTCTVRHGLAVPNPLYANMAKYLFAEHYPTAVKHVQDISGGTLATFPSLKDLENPATGSYIKKYLQGVNLDGAARLKLFQLVSDITTSDFGGYHAILAVHAEGSLEAEKLALYRSYNPQRVCDYVKSLLEK